LNALRSVAVFSVGLLFPLLGAAQDQPAATSATSTVQQFEVASVRMVEPYSETELRSGAGNHPLGAFPADRFVARHVPLDFLVSLAFNIDLHHVNTTENWQDEQLYDIAATVPGEQQLTLDQMRPMLRNLLSQRFHLGAHETERVVAGYSLIVRDSEPKLVVSATKNAPWAEILPDRLWGRGVGVSVLTMMFERLAGGPVLDKTGLSGKYDIDLHFRRQDDLNSNLPDIFTAVQEQLGLKLVPAKVPVTYLIIDHADRTPTEN
jgi:uncharacterized protein (TIGR03435 family)